jgi:hypothetical protein
MSVEGSEHDISKKRENIARGKNLFINAYSLYYFEYTLIYK